MAVNSLIEDFKKRDSYPDKEILQRLPASIMRRLNAVYEAVFDLTAPGGSTQIYRGHNHGDDGGGPVARGSILCCDNGAGSLFSGQLTTAGQIATKPIGRRYISPNMGTGDLSSFTSVTLCLVLLGGPVKIWLGSQEQYAQTINPTKEDIPIWLSFLCPITQDNGFYDLDMHLESTSTAVVDYEVLTIEESELASLAPDFGVRALPDSSGVKGSVLSFFGSEAALDEDFCQALDSLDSYTLKCLFWSLNGLYNGVQDRTAPGGSNQNIKGHDHVLISSGGGGGTQIPKSRIYSAGCQSLDSSFKAPFKSNNIVLSQWDYIDSGEAAAFRRTAGTPNQTTGAGAGAETIFEAFVSEGFTSSGSPPSTNPYLVAQVFLGGTTFQGGTSPSTVAAEMRFYNVTTGQLSPVVGVNSDATGVFQDYFHMVKIPCIGGQWNEFNIQVRSNSAPNFSGGGVGININTYYIALFECHFDGVQKATLLNSAGSRVAGAIRSKNTGLTP